MEKAMTPADSLPEILERIRSRLDVKFEPLEVDGETLQVLGIDNMPEHLDNLLAKHAIRNPLKDLPLWAKVWPASIVLGRFLRKYETARKTMLELGAGMGVCSLIASRFGFKKIVASDVNKDALDFARANALRNGLENIVSVKFLDVAAPARQLPEPFDFICASELLYLEELHRPLLKFLERNLAPGGKAFFCMDLGRRKSRFEKLAARGFQLESGCIGVKSADENGEERRIYHLIILEAK